MCHDHHFFVVVVAALSCIPLILTLSDVRFVLFDFSFAFLLVRSTS